MLRTLSLAVLLTAIGLSAALPAPAADQSANQHGYWINWQAYPQSAPNGAGCSNPTPGPTVNPDGYQTGSLLNIGQCTQLTGVPTGGPDNLFYWSTMNTGMLVGLFSSTDCNGPYKPFMTQPIYHEDGSITPGSGCEASIDLQGDPSVSNFQSVKILADCSFPSGCKFSL